MSQGDGSSEEEDEDLDGGEAVTVTLSEAGRLDRALAAALPALSRARLQALIAAGRVTVGGQPVRTSARALPDGTEVTVLVPAPVPAVPAAEPIPLSIVDEDEALLVLDKPAGLVVHPGAGVPAGTLVNALLHHCGDRLSGIGGVLRPGIVHRLDKETSGLMVVAKTDQAHRALQAQLADRTLGRRYLAAIWGRPALPSGRIEAPIGRHASERRRMAVTARGRPAATRWQLLRPLGSRAALIACDLETGRTHQIRVHLSHAGHPLVGDPLYREVPRGRSGPRREPAIDAALGRQALHAAALGFIHPLDGRPRRYTAPLPADLERILTELESF